MEKLNKVFRTAQLAAIDKYTIEHEPVSSLDLMERAAGIWTDRFLKIFTEVAGVVVIAGNGNNGGDGYAIARLLNRRGVPVRVFRIAGTQDRSPDCEANYRRWLTRGKVEELKQADDLVLQKGEIVIDAIFGSGLNRPVTGLAARIIKQMNASANRGACMQICRRAYDVKDKESDIELEVDNKYIMSPKDLKTIHFMDEMIEAGVRVFKIEGRARGPEYVRTVVECYKEAICSYLEGTFTEEKKQAWDERLKTVFNRGFWNGYYLGQRLGEWSKNYGSEATERKGIKYFSNIGVAEFLVEAAEMKVGDKLLITGPTTGAVFLTLDEARVDLKPVDVVRKGQHVSFKVPDKVRPSDKLYKLVSPEDLKKK